MSKGSLSFAGAVPTRRSGLVFGPRHRSGWALPWRGRARANVLKRGIDRCAEGFCASRRVGEHGAALMRGEQSNREATWIGVMGQVGAAAHRCQAVVKQRQPPFVTGGKVVKDL